MYAIRSYYELLAMIYQIGGFNRLQIARYLKQRNNPAVLATKYSQIV